MNFADKYVDKLTKLLPNVDPEETTKKIEAGDPTADKRYMYWIMMEIKNKNTHLGIMNRMRELLTAYEYLKPDLPAKEQDIDNIYFARLVEIVDGVDTFDAEKEKVANMRKLPHIYFVSRHPGAEEWFKRHYGDTHTFIVVSHFDPSKYRGASVAGTLPVHLAAEVYANGGTYEHLLLDVPADYRGKELSADDMDALGATLMTYKCERMSDKW